MTLARPVADVVFVDVRFENRLFRAVQLQEDPHLQPRANLTDARGLFLQPLGERREFIIVSVGMLAEVDLVSRQVPQHL